MQHKPILCLDFDGVCHSYTSGWQGAAVIPDEPVPGLWDALQEYAKVFEIHVFSARSHQEGGQVAMCNWFDKHAPYSSSCEAWELAIVWHDVGVCLNFPDNKTPALLSLDDRALTFNGTWPSAEELLAFQPWNKAVEESLRAQRDRQIKGLLMTLGALAEARTGLGKVDRMISLVLQMRRDEWQDEWNTE